MLAGLQEYRPGLTEARGARNVIAGGIGLAYSFFCHMRDPTSRAAHPGSIAARQSVELFARMTGRGLVQLTVPILVTAGLQFYQWAGQRGGGG